MRGYYDRLFSLCRRVTVYVQNFPVVSMNVALFIARQIKLKAILTFFVTLDCVFDEIFKCDHSNESCSEQYFPLITFTQYSAKKWISP